MTNITTWLRCLGRDIWQILHLGLDNLRHWHRSLVLTSSLLVLLLPLSFHFDTTMLALLCSHAPGSHQIARFLSHWGDYLTWTVPFFLLLLVLGSFSGRTSWRRAAIACLLAASFAGLCANALSFAVGRPRPSTSKPDGVYGPRWDYNNYRSFPSGHAATSLGTATALSVALPPLGIPCLFYAVGVGWSRMELNRHYPTDILVGSILGVVFGLAFGTAARRLTNKPQ